MRGHSDDNEEGTVIIKETHDGKIVILGGGPAGCTAALYTARADLKPLVLEGEISQTLLPGGQLMTTTEVENFPGYPEGVSGPELMADLKKQAEKFGARFEYKTVTSVDLSGYPLKLFVNEEVYETQALIIATGATARYLGLESEQRFMNKGVSGPAPPATAPCPAFAASPWSWWAAATAPWKKPCF